MSGERRRALLFALPGALLSGVLLVGLLGLPDFGHALHPYARYVAGHGTSQRHVTNLVAAIVFDYRGIDTLGEETILFAAVIGAALLLRGSRRVQEQQPEDPAPSDAARGFGGAFPPAVLLLGLWVVAFGYITPGGGFQGGVIIGGAILLLWVAGSYPTFQRATPELAIHVAEGGAIAAILATGLLALARDRPYLANVIRLGSPGQLLSGGTIAILNGLTGVAVAAGVVLLLREFLQEHVQTLPGAEEEPS
jgi:multicomponent Na+:H+ antiporter subunit B